MSEIVIRVQMTETEQNHNRENKMRFKKIISQKTAHERQMRTDCIGHYQS
jgi:hypothetical protein